ncbi:MAG: YgaP family membrane protein [Eubacteriaceae bacterium]
MKKNMGIIDAYARLTCGLTMFGIGICRKSKCMITLGAMKTAEGITCFCPIYYLMGMSTRKRDNIIGLLKELK